MHTSPDKLTHRFGVNYVPSKNWYYCYNNWNASDIRADLEAVANLGADHIRMMLIWPWFQPNPSYISEQHLSHLNDMLGIAAEMELDVLVTLYNGWLSGYGFLPPFLLDEPFYTAPAWQKAQLFYLQGVSQVAMTHDNFLGFDLGNEINCCWETTPAVGDVWMKNIFQAMKKLCPGRIHVNGVDHKPWFTENSFSPEALLAEQSIIPLHCWPFWTGAGKYGGPLDTPYTHLTAGMAALARAYGNTPEKPIWAQEFGVCSEEMPEEDVPRWLETSVTVAIAQGVSWFTWWCSHDVDPRFEFHPFEYHLGLLTQENRLKPQGEVFKELAQAYRGKAVSIPQTSLPPAPQQRTEDTVWQWLLDWMRENS